VRAPRVALVLILLAAGFGISRLVPAASRSPTPQQGRPNLLFILTDDQRFDTLSVMRATRADFDVVFENGFVTTPLCCPSRSSILTGRYASHTGVHGNRDYPRFVPQEAESIGPWLDAMGYYTGFVGKYLNRVPVDKPAPPGWDEFYGLVYDLEGEDGPHGPILRERWMDGDTERQQVVHEPRGTEYTALWTREALRFLHRAADPTVNPDGAPWALFVWTNAPHQPDPDARYRDGPVPGWTPPPSFLEADRSDKPLEVRAGPGRIGDAEVHREVREDQLRQLLSVDDLVARLFAYLDGAGLRERTWGIFSSDNGVFWGEHLLSRKLYAYEEAIRVPLRMAVPGSGPRRIDPIVANVDLAPTLLELAGDRTDHGMDGRSLVGLATGRDPRPVREALLIENWANVYWEGVRTPQWKYVHWIATGAEELYDLRADPYELENLAASRHGIVKGLRSKLRRLRQSSPGVG